MAQVDDYIVQMKQPFTVMWWLACLVVGMNTDCLGFTILAPATNQIACLNLETGEIKWKTSVPFEANSRLIICDGNLRVMSSTNSSKPVRVANLDVETGHLLPGSFQNDCLAPSGRTYGVSEETSEFFQERWRITPRNVIGERLEFVDSKGDIRWVIERKAICDTVVARGDFLVIGSHEWKRKRRPMLSAFLKGADAPVWIFDLQRIRIPKGRHSDYLTAEITEQNVFVYWAGVLFKLDKRNGGEISRADCSKYGLSRAGVNEGAILIPLPSSIIVFHPEKILCLKQDSFTVVWSHNPHLEANLLPFPLLDDGLMYFFQGDN